MYQASKLLHTIITGSGHEISIPIPRHKFTFLFQKLRNSILMILKMQISVMLTFAFAVFHSYGLFANFMALQCTSEGFVVIVNHAGKWMKITGSKLVNFSHFPLLL